MNVDPGPSSKLSIVSLDEFDRLYLVGQLSADFPRKTALNVAAALAQAVERAGGDLSHKTLLEHARSILTIGCLT